MYTSNHNKKYINKIKTKKTRRILVKNVVDQYSYETFWK